MPYQSAVTQPTTFVLKPFGIHHPGCDVEICIHLQQALGCPECWGDLALNGNRMVLNDEPASGRVRAIFRLTGAPLPLAAQPKENS